MSIQPLPLAPFGVFAKMQAIATCLCAQIETDGLPTPCFCGVIPGEAAVFDYIDGCDNECGMAWVRLDTAQPTTGIGIVNETLNNCGSEVGFQVEVGIVRCFPIPEDGNPPTEAEYLEGAELQVADMLCMRRALACCDIGDFILDAYTPIGPDGMVLGGLWQATLGEL